MLRSALTLVSPPASEPITLSEAKAWARIDGSAEDALLATLISAARCTAEEYLRRSLISQSWKMTIDLCGSSRAPWFPGEYDLPVNYFDGEMPRAIDLPRGPVSSIASVTTYDLNGAAALFDPSKYRLDAASGRFILNYGSYWPGGIRSQAGVEIVYVAGYGSDTNIPQPIKTGIMIHVASLYEQRGLCEDSMDLPPATKQFYAQYRIMGDL